MFAEASGHDPRRRLSADDLKLASTTAAPDVARPASAADGLGLAAGVVAALALGGVTLVTLNAKRTAPPAKPEAAPVATAPATPAAPQPVVLAAAPPPPVPAPQVAPAPPPPTGVDPNQSRAGPMVIDNTATEAAAPRVLGGLAASTAPQGQLSADEQFALRAGNDAPPSARASSLADPAGTVVQGAIIPAVLETALNSDLPGYARAIVSRDVRGFDGSRVLIPRGSRLIGQYKSGVATGQSRAFVVWTRLIRPDGVSVQLASPVTDESGQAGIGGKVDRHFAQRFGAAILLSVVSGAASSLGHGSSSTVVIGSSGDASSAAGQALQTDGKISPTIRVAQGTPVQVFVARDLEFGR
ncbi:TrbI/VirB10 family protein [Caulobacter hibisci]|uniref:TrbI/VirB10 family protein n=1 Tax=Caulobacter hibisci TaxID=2035993 RepID=A0ABS0ST75_9CAUL|nr:TrbI/VirB10 family protein [Caulobacter hibisci]MBI1682857.1 TrbI/VirB10 family protein [Caulobacter hibisci]